MRYRSAAAAECTLRGDLLKTVKSLSEENKYDYLVIESTGISEPLPVAQTFTMNVDGHQVKDEPSTAGAVKSLSHFARLDTMATVVDAANIFDVLRSIETLADEHNMARMKGNKVDPKAGQNQVDDRSLAQLMLDQIEFANVIVLSKAQLVVAEKEGLQKIDVIKNLLQKLNPRAEIVVSAEDAYTDLDTERWLMNTRKFNMEQESSYDAWIKKQMELPMTSHRAYYRTRVNPRDVVSVPACALGTALWMNRCFRRHF